MQTLSRKVVAAGASLAFALAACVGAGADDWQTATTSGPMGPGNPIAGARTYQSTCASCHGADLQGVEGLGKGLVPSAFVAESSEAELVDFLRGGRQADHPENITGIPMPPRGGNPAVSDQDLANVAAYLIGQQ